MKSLTIESTRCTPEILFDPGKGIYSISGSSYPENSFEFYKPIIEWVDSFVKNNQNEVELNVQMKYFDSTSSKFLIIIFEKFEIFHRKGPQVIINSLYDEEDLDDLENAEELFIGIKVPYRFIRK